MAFTLKSKSFKDKQFLDKKFRCEDEDISPHLELSDAPLGTKSFKIWWDKRVAFERYGRAHFRD